MARAKPPLLVEEEALDEEDETLTDERPEPWDDALAELPPDLLRAATELARPGGAVDRTSLPSGRIRVTKQPAPCAEFGFFAGPADAASAAMVTKARARRIVIENAP